MGASIYGSTHVSVVQGLFALGQGSEGEASYSYKLKAIYYLGIPTRCKNLRKNSVFWSSTSQNVKIGELQKFYSLAVLPAAALISRRLCPLSKQ